MSDRIYIDYLRDSYGRQKAQRMLKASTGSARLTQDWYKKEPTRRENTWWGRTNIDNPLRVEADDLEDNEITV